MPHIWDAKSLQQEKYAVSSFHKLPLHLPQPQSYQGFEVMQGLCIIIFLALKNPGKTILPEIFIKILDKPLDRLS